MYLYESGCCASGIMVVKKALSSLKEMAPSRNQMTTILKYCFIGTIILISLFGVAKAFQMLFNTINTPHVEKLSEKQQAEFHGRNMAIQAANVKNNAVVDIASTAMLGVLGGNAKAARIFGETQAIQVEKSTPQTILDSQSEYFNQCASYEVYNPDIPTVFGEDGHTRKYYQRPVNKYRKIISVC